MFSTSDFVIIGAARSGTTLLVDLLNCSQDVKCLYEIFHPDLLQVDGVDRDELRKVRDELPGEFLRTIRGEFEQPAFGFKIFGGHNDDHLSELIGDDSLRKIVVHRSNGLAVYSSRLISAKKKLYAETGARSVPGFHATGSWDDQVEFDSEGFLSHLAQHQNFYRSVTDKLNERCQPFAFIEYEQLLNERLVRRLFSFLGAVQPESLTTGLLRNNRSDVINRFTNPADVLETLESIGRQSWIHEANGAWNV